MLTFASVEEADSALTLIHAYKDALSFGTKVSHRMVACLNA